MLLNTECPHGCAGYDGSLGCCKLNHEMSMSAYDRRPPELRFAVRHSLHPKEGWTILGAHSRAMEAEWLKRHRIIRVGGEVK
jgi:hypothetical protein